jgi:hypothetical protein
MRGLGVIVAGAGLVIGVEGRDSFWNSVRDEHALECTRFSALLRPGRTSGGEGKDQERSSDAGALGLSGAEQEGKEDFACGDFVFDRGRGGCQGVCRYRCNT